MLNNSEEDQTQAWAPEVRPAPAALVMLSFMMDPPMSLHPAASRSAARSGPIFTHDACAVATWRWHPVHTAKQQRATIMCNAPSALHDGAQHHERSSRWRHARLDVCDVRVQRQPRHRVHQDTLAQRWPPPRSPCPRRFRMDISPQTCYARILGIRAPCASVHGATCEPVKAVQRIWILHTLTGIRTHL